MVRCTKSKKVKADPKGRGSNIWGWGAKNDQASNKEQGSGKTTQKDLKSTKMGFLIIKYAGPGEGGPREITRGNSSLEGCPKPVVPGKKPYKKRGGQKVVQGRGIAPLRRGGKNRKKRGPNLTVGAIWRRRSGFRGRVPIE